jgi:hypothetical protein
LPFHIAAGLTKILQPDGAIVDAVQSCQHVVRCVIHRTALFGRAAGQQAIGVDAAVDVVHHIEHGADDAVIVTQQVHARHRHTSATQCLHHFELAIYGVGRRQKLTRWLLAQNESATVGLQVERGIRETTLELMYPQVATELGNALAQIAFERSFIEAIVGQHRHQHRGASALRFRHGCFGHEREAAFSRVRSRRRHR